MSKIKLFAPLIATSLLGACSKPEPPAQTPTGIERPAVSTETSPEWKGSAVPSLGNLPALPQHLADRRERVLAIEVSCAPPKSDSMADLNTWLKDSFGPCLENKSSLLKQLEPALTTTAGRRDSVGEAIVGHMNESLANQLLGMPIPREIASDAELTAVYRKALVDKANPYLEGARAAYSKCEEDAPPSAEPDAVRWHSFCQARSGAVRELLAAILPKPEDATAPGQGVPPGYGIIGVWRGPDAGPPSTPTK